MKDFVGLGFDNNELFSPKGMHRPVKTMSDMPYSGKKIILTARNLKSHDIINHGRYETEDGYATARAQQNRIMQNSKMARTP